MMRNLLILIATTVLFGCKNTPYSDDYVQAIGTNGNQTLKSKSFKVVLQNPNVIDIRGDYEKNDSIQGQNILYAGNAGIVGLFAQVATHAALSSSSRNSKLSEQQKSANQEIVWISDLFEDVTTKSLINTPVITNFDDEFTHEIYIKPIFFVNSELTKIELKVIAAIPNNKVKSKKKKLKYIYRNMFQVHSPPIERRQVELLRKGDGTFLHEHFSEMTNSAIELIKNDVKGYFNNSAENKSYMLKINKKDKIRRGAIIAQDCVTITLKTLRKWLILIPRNMVTLEGEPVPLQASCNI